MAVSAQDRYVANMTPAQSRAARGLLNWTEDRLASAAGVKVSVVREFEGEKAVPRPAAQALQRAFEAAGIEFSNHGAPGVRQQPTPAVLRVDELNASNDE
jgi:transcriptional regulator with XRE-family HTH domain